MPRQVKTRRVTVEWIMSTRSFALGVEDRRNGAPPQFDREETSPNRLDQWEYERGRLWASLAPLTMPLRIGKKLNPKAVALCRVAFDRGYIT
jgi:hypothetical protein